MGYQCFGDDVVSIVTDKLYHNASHIPLDMTSLALRLEDS